MKVLSLSSIYNAAELIISWFIGYLQLLVDYNASLYSVTERFFFLNQQCILHCVLTEPQAQL